MAKIVKMSSLVGQPIVLEFSVCDLDGTRVGFSETAGKVRNVKGDHWVGRTFFNGDPEVYECGDLDWTASHRLPIRQTAEAV